MAYRKSDGQWDFAYRDREACEDSGIGGKREQAAAHRPCRVFILSIVNAAFMYVYSSLFLAAHTRILAFAFVRVSALVSFSPQQQQPFCRDEGRDESRNAQRGSKNSPGRRSIRLSGGFSFLSSEGMSERGE